MQNLLCLRTYWSGLMAPCTTCTPSNGRPRACIPVSTVQLIFLLIHLTIGYILYGLGGADTTVSTMLSLFMCMALFPEAQRMAQVEIDSAIGYDRLPTLEDRSDLPYVEAIISEVMRWAPVGPMGEHFSLNDACHIIV